MGFFDMATILEYVTFNDGTYAEILDIDYNGSVVQITYRQLVLVLADGSAFSVGTTISGDDDNDNDAVGIVREKLDENTVVVEKGLGDFVASNGVDDTDPYAADVTTIVEVQQNIKVKRISSVEADFKIGEYV